MVEANGKRITIEIETGKSDTIYNIVKDLESGFKVKPRAYMIGINIKAKYRL